MFERTRKSTEQALSMSKQITDWQVAQAKIAKDQADAAFAAGQKSIELAQKQGETLTKAWLDAVAPVDAE